LFTNAKTVYEQLLCMTNQNCVSSKIPGQMTHEKLDHQLFTNSHLWHEGQSRFHAIYPVH